eukprot:3451851-Prymnesium_polylepis.1
MRGGTRGGMSCGAMTIKNQTAINTQVSARAATVRSTGAKPAPAAAAAPFATPAGRSCRSASLSQRASLGRSGRLKSTPVPMAIVGTACRPKTHRHPSTPAAPSKYVRIRQAEPGVSSAFRPAEQAMNTATASPMVEHGAGEVERFGEPQERAQADEPPHSRRRRRARCEHTREQERRAKHATRTHALDQPRAWHLKQRIRHEEDARGGAKGFGAQLKVAAHARPHERDVASIH